MPTQKDFKRLVRSRMTRTGEAYTTARQQLLDKAARADAAPEAPSSAASADSSQDLAGLAGMREEAVLKQTGRTWAEWVRLLDEIGAVDKPHGEIARHVAALGTPDWWTQAVTVGYERIRGLRQRGQRRGGDYEASKSRTFGVAVSRLFEAFADTRTRRRWLDADVTVRSATRDKRMRLAWHDGTTVQLEFATKGPAKSAVAVQHQKLPDRAAADAMKGWWSDRFDRLGRLLQ